MLAGTPGALIVSLVGAFKDETKVWAIGGLIISGLFALLLFVGNL